MINYTTTSSMIDAYCERTSDGLWAEPLNLITSIAFIIAAILLLRLAWSPGGNSLKKSWDLWLLLASLAAVGLGSLLWHSFAREWAHQADLRVCQ